MKVSVFRRRRSAGVPFAALLENYLVRAEAVADGGGGNLWVIEPTLPADLLPDVAEAVTLHLADHGVATDGFTVLEGTASVRVVVLAAVPGDARDDGRAQNPDDDALDDGGHGALPDVPLRPAGRAPQPPAPLSDEELLDLPLRPADRTPPAPRRPPGGDHTPDDDAEATSVAATAF